MKRFGGDCDLEESPDGKYCLYEDVQQKEWVNIYAGKPDLSLPIKTLHVLCRFETYPGKVHHEVVRFTKRQGYDACFEHHSREFITHWQYIGEPEVLADTGKP